MSNGNGGRGAGCQLALYLGVLGIAAVVVGTYMAFEKMSGEQISLAVTRFQDFVLFAIFGAILIVVARIASGRRSEPPPQQPQQPQYPPVIVVSGQPQLPQQQRPALTDDDYRFWDSGRRWESTGGWEDERPAGRRAENIVGGWPDAAEASESFADAHPDLVGNLVDGFRSATDFQSDEDIIQQFIEDWCSQDGTWAGATELYEAYCSYVQELDWQPATQQVFGAELMQLGVPRRRSSSGYMYQIAVDV